MNEEKTEKLVWTAPILEDLSLDSTEGGTIKGVESSTQTPNPHS